MLCKIATQLKYLSDKYSVAMLVINQVSDVVDDSHVVNFGARHIPALGLTWSNCVNTRIMITRTTRLWVSPTVPSPTKTSGPPTKKAKVFL